MFGFKPQRSWIATVIVAVLLFFLGGCSDRLSASAPPLETASPPVVTAKLQEVAPPSVIQALNKSLDQYQPQVRILSPQPNQFLSDTTVDVTLAVQDFPIFKDKTLEMGPNLHFILDNEPYQTIYDLSQPITLTDLSPGTHTLRVFAARPWHESFKNEGAYAQTTFHVFTQTEHHAPDPNLPLLTYNQPKGNYGAEPILIDFYLTNAPLHVAALENESLADWRIRVTVNGESFLLDNWQPIYLKGFEKGANWIKLEFLDEQGNTVDNAFNNTARLITYTPKGADTLSKLVRGDISAEMAYSIVNMKAPVVIPPFEIPPVEIIEEEIPEEAVIEEVPPEIIEETSKDEVEIPSETEPTPIESPSETKPQPILLEPQETEILLLVPESVTEDEAENTPPVTEKPQKELPPVEIIEKPQILMPTETVEKPSEEEDLSDLNSTDLQLKLLESIEQLEKRLDDLETIRQPEIKPILIPLEKSDLPELKIPNSSPPQESVQDNLKNRLKKWRELLQNAQS